MIEVLGLFFRLAVGVAVVWMVGWLLTTDAELREREQRAQRRERRLRRECRRDLIEEIAGRGGDGRWN